MIKLESLHFPVVHNLSSMLFYRAKVCDCCFVRTKVSNFGLSKGKDDDSDFFRANVCGFGFLRAKVSFFGFSLRVRTTILAFLG